MSSLIYENLAVQRKIARKNSAKSVSCRTPPGNLLRLTGNCAPHALGVIAVLHVVRRTARFVSAREAELLHLCHDSFDRNEEKPSIGSAAMSSRLPDR
jgi:hypothetical protein